MRRFEYAEGNSSKFWEIEQVGNDLNIRWGRIGTAGQSQTKNFADATKAATAMTKLIAEKSTKGYTEQGVAASTTIGAAAPKAEKPKPKKEAKAVADSVEIKSDIDATQAAIETEEKITESIDQQTERAFKALCQQIIDGTLEVPKDGLSIARLKRASQINELAANQVHKLMHKHGLLTYYSNILPENAKQIAIAIGEKAQDRRAQVASQNVIQTSDATDNLDGVPPWLAQGEPLYFGAITDLRSAALPSRRFPKSINAVDPQLVWLKMREEIKTSFIPDFAASDPTLSKPYEEAWQTLDNRKMSGTPETDAVLLALCLPSQGRNSTLGVQFVVYLVARYGIVYLIDTLLAAASIQLMGIWGPNNKVYKRHLTRDIISPIWVSGGPVLSTGEWSIRAYLANAVQSDYDTCVEKIRKALPSIHPMRQPALALLLPDVPEISNELVFNLCSVPGKAPDTVHWLQLTATDPAAIAMARKAKFSGYLKFWDCRDMVATILQERGVDAVQWLAVGAEYEPAGEGLSCIGTPESMEAIARAARSSKEALARLHLAVDRWPVASFVALARILSGSSRDHDYLQPTLIQLMRANPTLPAQLRPWLEPSANALIAKLEARLAGPQDVASNAELPEVLADAPWLHAKKKAAQALQLAPLPLAPIENWDADAKQAATSVSEWEQKNFDSYRKDASIMTQALGFSYKEMTPERKAAINALNKRDGVALLEAWQAMHAEKKKERYYYFSVSGKSIGQLPIEIGPAFWNAVACETTAYHAEYVAAIWGLAVFPGLLARITSAPTENFFIALNFGAVEIAPIAARAFAKLKSLRAQGRQWLKRYPEYAACALIAPALGKPSEARDCAASALRLLAASGHTKLLEEVARRYQDEQVVVALHAVLNENPLDRFPSKRPALPDFWQPSGWNGIMLRNGKALPPTTLDLIGTMMTFPTNEEIYAGLHQLKAACSADSLANFAWDCFSAWLNAGAPSKEGWALTSLGLFGNDDVARKLTPYIRAWPGESAHARAVTGLDVLATIGSDVALMLLNGIAQKVKFKGLQDKAVEKINAIAEARGLTKEELEDRLAPDLGLDEQGSMVLDFGPRSFKVGFDEALRPYVREWMDNKPGARLADLPKPKKTDDEALAKEATERFKLLKKDARTIASQQVLRLEVAMCSRRRWTPEVFDQFLSGHPLICHLVRRLVWSVYEMPREEIGEGDEQEAGYANYGGALHSCFRVSEDGGLTDAHDDPYTLPEGAQYKIGLPHALELPASDAADFGQLLADYELLQPFPQLGRDTYALTEAEKNATTLERWKGMTVPTGKILGLVNIGWRRGPAQDGGCIWTFDKPIDRSRAIELSMEPGIIVAMVNEYPEQKLHGVTVGEPQRWGGNQNTKPFATLDPIVASELIRDMERLRA